MLTAHLPKALYDLAGVDYCTRYFVFGCLYTALCLLPLLVMNFDFDDTTLISSLDSRRFLLAAALSVGCTTPMMIESLVDVVANTKHKDWRERLIIVLSLFLPQFYAIVSESRNSFFAQTYALLSNCSTIAFLGAIFSSLSRLGNYHFTLKCMEGIFSIYAICVVVKCFALVDTSIYDGASFASVVGTTSVLAFMILYPYGDSNKFDFSIFLKFGSYNALTPIEYSWLVYLEALFCSLVGSYLLNLFTEGSTWAESSASNLAGISYIRAIFTLVVSILPGRLMHFREYSTRNELLMKRSFVKYVSFELSGPLNILYSNVEQLYALMNKLSSTVTCQHRTMSSQQPNLSKNPGTFPFFRPTSTGFKQKALGSALPVNFLNKISSIGQQFENCMLEMHPACLHTNGVLTGLLDYDNIDEPEQQILSKTTVSVIKLFDSVISSLQDTHFRSQAIKKSQSTNPFDSGDDADPGVLVSSTCRDMFELQKNNVTESDFLSIDSEKVERALKSLLGSMIYSGFVANSKSNVILVSLFKDDRKGSEGDGNTDFDLVRIGKIKISVGIAAERHKQVSRSTSSTTVFSSQEKSANNWMSQLFRKNSPSTSSVDVGIKDEVDFVTCEPNVSNFLPPPAIGEQESDPMTGRVSVVNVFVCGKVFRLHGGSVEVGEPSLSHNFDLDLDRIMKGEVVLIAMPLFNAAQDTSISAGRTRRRRSTKGSRNSSWFREMLGGCLLIHPDSQSDSSVCNEQKSSKSDKTVMTTTMKSESARRSATLSSVKSDIPDTAPQSCKFSDTNSAKSDLSYLAAGVMPMQQSSNTQQSVTYTKSARDNSSSGDAELWQKSKDRASSLRLGEVDDDDSSVLVSSRGPGSFRAGSMRSNSCRNSVQAEGSNEMNNVVLTEC